MGIVANTVAAVGIAGTITLGALTQWGGGAAITNAKALIVQQADALGIFHTNEGKLLNKISDLKTNITSLNNQITQLQSSGTADSTQIASLQAQVTKDQSDLANLNTQLAAANTNGNALAQRVDDLQAQLDQANKDATDLQATTTANATVATSDQTSVDAATSGTTSTTTPPATTTPPPATGDVMLSDASNIKMLTGVPYAMGTENVLTLNTLADGTVQVTNTDFRTWTATVNGQAITIAPSSTATIGKSSDLDKHNLVMSATGKINQDYWLTNN